MGSALSFHLGRLAVLLLQPLRRMRTESLKSGAMLVSDNLETRAHCGQNTPAEPKFAAQRLICECFYTDNYHIKEVNRHVSYVDRRSFENSEEGRKILTPLGTARRETIIAALEQESRRRHNLLAEALDRSKHIRAHYKPLHPEVYELRAEWIHPELEAIRATLFSEGGSSSQASKAEVRALRNRLREYPPGVFSFPVFTRDFCQRFVAEARHFNESDMPKARPNSMNKEGVLLEECGYYEGLLDPLLDKYLKPIAAQLYPDYGGATLDHHRSFTVKYHEDGDVELAYHYDDSEVTLNVCLGEQFEGGELLFGSMRDCASQTSRYPLRHDVGTGVLHRGHHMHEAVAVDSGVRLNLIMWLRSSTERNFIQPEHGRQRPVKIPPTRGSKAAWCCHFNEQMK
ncbi:hypothetical protein CYMTET_4787 [Cymbomonas tetramitiformis]|uniref:Fe2OG dioxygenase domain-containing protein n=1 Tax=Cymbomonas tetramitiformis TaxID=36881 RepID=A0AAE0H0P6_9CHLO|nr:hypothetical protein CYMTET_4787 [Cymbomonas tetramitiformis]